MMDSYIAIFQSNCIHSKTIACKRQVFDRYRKIVDLADFYLFDLILYVPSTIFQL